LNLPGTRDLARKDRKSDHFVLSRDYCGSRATGYVPTGKYTSGKFKLCNAMTISGAALSSLMGYQTSFARAFAMTLFNVRLGYWVYNPRNYGDATVYLEDSPWQQGKRYRCEGRWQFWPYYLFREMTATASARDSLVHVSDGGHTGDNVGVYPLLQRRCKLIIACDAERDPEYTFSSLMRAARQIYTDENLGIDIDLSRIQPKASGEPAQAHFAVGRVTTRRVIDKKEEVVAWILYLKSSFTGKDEPVTVRSYAKQHTDFPHQTTGDQFFDDEQFEAYRSLGARITINTLKELTGKEEPDDLTADDLIEYCRAHFEGREPEDVVLPPRQEPDRAASSQEDAESEDEREKQRLIAALKDSTWNQAKAARSLGWTPSALRYRMKKHGVKRPSGT
jgi:hypothetical protein